MTYEEAKKLKPGDRIEVRATAKNLTVSNVRTDPENRIITISCDDGTSYGHKQVNPGAMQMFLDQGTPPETKRRYFGMVAGSGTWFEDAEGRLIWMYDPDPDQLKQLYARAGNKRIVRQFQS